MKKIPLLEDVKVIKINEEYKDFDKELQSLGSGDNVIPSEDFVNQFLNDLDTDDVAGDSEEYEAWGDALGGMSGGQAELFVRAHKLFAWYEFYTSTKSESDIQEMAEEYEDMDKDLKELSKGTPVEQYFNK
jgi:hypothetical protein